MLVLYAALETQWILLAWPAKCGKKNYWFVSQAQRHGKNDLSYVYAAFNSQCNRCECDLVAVRVDAETLSSSRFHPVFAALQCKVTAETLKQKPRKNSPGTSFSFVKIPFPTLILQPESNLGGTWFEISHQCIHYRIYIYIYINININILIYIYINFLTIQCLPSTPWWSDCRSGSANKSSTIVIFI